MGILEEKGIPVPKGFLASNPQEAASCFSKLSAKSAVVKAQILAGGRGRGIFSSGLQGGIQVVNS